MKLRDLFLRVRALVAPRRVERELDEELAFHIERDTQRYVAGGLSPEDARRRALARFGPVALAADQCRDARGIAFVDDLARDISYAFRTFHRAPLVALTIVVTVALGLGLVAAVFAVYSMIFLRVDAVRSPGELFAVEREGPRAEAAFTRLEYEAMRRETSVFTDALAMLRRVGTRMEGRPVSSTLVTGNFFQVLGVQAALGRTLMPGDSGNPGGPGDDDRFGGQSVIVLSHAAWNGQFAADPTVIGRSVQINGRPYEIVGVMPEDFRGLQISAPDYWAPLAIAGQFRDDYAGKEDGIPVEVVGRLKPGMSPEAATAALTAWTYARNDPPPLRAERASASPASIKLTPRQGTAAVDLVQSLMAFSPIFFTFGLILMIGCANVANLLLARGVSRQRELGIRLSLGASRWRIVRQLLTENLLLALAAAACGLIVSRLFLAAVLHAATNTTSGESVIFEVELARFTPATDWRVVVFLIVGAIASTALFGLLPALQSTRLELVRTMRGELSRDAGPGRARSALIAVQVCASALLLICAAIFLRGALATATVDPGVRTSDTMMLFLDNEARRPALLQAVTAHPSVAAVAASSEPTRAVAETSLAGVSSRVPVELLAVSPEYFEVLGIDVVGGRGFTRAERNAEAGVVVVSETVAGQLWPNRNAIGQVMRLSAQQTDSSAGAPPPPSPALTVVGIARDPAGRNRNSYLFTFRGVYLPTGSESRGTSLMLQVRGDPDQTRQALLGSLTSIEPDLAIVTVRYIAQLQTYMLKLAFGVTVVLGGLALLLTVSGLFSVLSYVVEQQAKDIGVRMALGATTRNIASLVLSQSLGPVGIGLAAGGGLAVALAIVLMATPLASEIGGVIRVFDPAAYAASGLLIGAACLLGVLAPALRAARIDPIATLRRD
jgi:predicted permease